MGFLDKVKNQAETLAKQGQERIDDMQSKKKADGLLRDLGAWYYAVQTNRDEGKGLQEMGRIVNELREHEDEHGPLGSSHDDAPADDAPPPPAAAASPSSPPPTMPPPVSAPPTMPPPVSAPPTMPPPVSAPPTMPPADEAPGGLGNP